jgi:hypothetical protein
MMKKWPLKRRQGNEIPKGDLAFTDEGREVFIEGEVVWVSPPEAEGKACLRADTPRQALLAKVRTDDSTIEVRIFHPTAFHRRFFVRGALVKLLGKLTRWHGRLCLVHPRIIFR